ncbi:MAG: substrate-binding periplasmic protein [Pseudobdellovibrionaceae bacterium]
MSFSPSVFLMLIMANVALPQLAQATCSRPIIVPASSLGKMVIVNDSTGEVSGIYPELLRERGQKAGCTFVFPIVPRARAELMVSSGESDLLVGSVKVPERDAWAGDYVAIHGSEWMLASLLPTEAPKSVEELLARPGLKFNAVRGYNYGPEYLAMLETLKKQGKLEYMKDPESIVRKMQIGRADYTMMPASTFAGALYALGLKEKLGPKVRYTHLAGLPTTVNGVYLSKKLSAQDMAAVKKLLIEIRNEDAVMIRMKKIFTKEELVSHFPLPK